ncbi:MAG: PPC domain-containing protein [Candidatus Thorarchaeota archaeon]
MDLKKIYKRGFFVSVLLLAFTLGIFFNPSISLKYITGGKSVSISSPDDKYEPNNTYLTAYNLSEYEDVWLSSINGSGILEDDDFYMINIKMGFQHLKVNLTFIHALGDMNIEVWDSGAVILTGSSSVTDNEYIDYIAPSPGVYFIRIFGPNQSNIYDLWWKTYQMDDVYEENDFDWEAFDLSPFEDMWLSSIAGLGVQFDDDWYEIYVSTGMQHLMVTLMFMHSNGDIDIELYSSGLSVITGGYSITDNEYIDIIVPSSGIYYLKVYLANNGAPYDLWWNTTVYVITDDAYEENDFDWQAYDLSSYEATWLSSISGLGILYDEDWYQIELDFGEERLKADLIFTHSNGNIDIELFDWNYVYITGSYSMDDNEHLEVNLGFNGTYYIRIYGDLTGNTYDLWWEDLSMTVSGDDWMEENDDFWTSRWVDPNYYPMLRIIEADEDWYHLYLNPNDVLDVSIYFSHIEGDLDLEIYDPSNVHRAGSYSTDNDEFVSYIADMSGDWRIRVYHVYGDTNVTYDLDIWLNPGDDFYEENDYDFEAYDLTSYNRWWLTSINGPGFQFDEDWFKIYIALGFEHLRVSVLFDHIPGNIDIELYDSSNSFVVGSYSSDNDEFIDITLSTYGEYYIRVFGSNSGNFYDLQYETFNTKGDDPYEENDDYREAYDITHIEGWWLSGYAGLGMQYDEDWFRVDVPLGFEYLVINLICDNTMDLELYDSNGKFITGSYNPQNGEHIQTKLPKKGTYYIRIFGDNKGSYYDLQFLTLFELEEQTWISDIHGKGIQKKPDWYMIDVSVGYKHLVVDLIFDHSQGNIDLSIFDSTSSYSDGNYSITDNEHFESILPHPGIYILVVHGDNMGNEYDLWWDDLKTDLRTDDAYELNNDLLSAYDLSSYKAISMWNLLGPALQFDEDWYKIYVDETELSLIVEVTYDSAEGLMGFEIYDSNYTKITSNFTLKDNDHIKYVMPSEGIYYIRVYGDNSGNLYTLWWDTEKYESVGGIPGFDLLILMGSILGIIILLIKLKRSKFKNK